MSIQTGSGTSRRVTSADGTRIGYEAVGTGSPLIAVHGGTADRSRWAAVAALLSRDHELWMVDRRGRGLSGDAPDGGYSLEREVDDVVALAAEAGPGAAVLAHSAGAAFALAAAPRLDLAALVLYEPAFATPGHPLIDEVTFAAIEQHIAAGRREEALTLFLRAVVELPDPAIDAMRATPVWQARLAAVHTITREGRALETYAPDPAALAALPFPVLVLAGTESPAFLRAASDAAHRAIAGSRYVELDDQGHMAMDTAPELFARAVLGFVSGAGARPRDAAQAPAATGVARSTTARRSPPSSIP